MAFFVIKSDAFHVIFNSFADYEKGRIRKFLIQIVEHGNQVGQPIRFEFFREKKFNGKRMYFLVYNEWNAILLVTFSDKKEQPKVITEIILQLPYYKEFVRTRLIEMGII